jgi:regulator of extracellular matrix RemA (YlzA/DUF370 family)
MPDLFLNIGHGNAVRASQVVAILNPSGAPVVRLRSDARKAGRLVDVSQGHRTRSVILTASGHVFESSLEVSELTGRFNKAFSGRGAGRYPGSGPDVGDLAGSAPDGRDGDVPDDPFGPAGPGEP